MHIRTLIHGSRSSWNKTCFKVNIASYEWYRGVVANGMAHFNLSLGFRTLSGINTVHSVNEFSKPQPKNLIICCADNHRYKSGGDEGVLPYYISAAVCLDTAVNSYFICWVLRWHLQITVTRWNYSKPWSGTHFKSKYCKSAFLKCTKVIDACFSFLLCLLKPKLKMNFRSKGENEACFWFGKRIFQHTQCFLG